MSQPQSVANIGITTSKINSVRPSSPKYQNGKKRMTSLSTMTTKDFIENVRRELDFLIENLEEETEHKEILQGLMTNVEYFQDGTEDPDVFLFWSWEAQEEQEE